MQTKLKTKIMKKVFAILIMALAFVSCVDEKTEKEVIITPAQEEVQEVEVEVPTVEVDAAVEIDEQE